MTSPVTCDNLPFSFSFLPAGLTYTMYASPALSANGSLAYVGTGGNLMFAVNTSSFIASWKFDSGASQDDNWQSSPVVAASGAVFFATCDAAIHAVDGSSGALLWSYTTTDVSRGSGALGAGGQLYCGADSGVVALDSATGALLWNTTLVAPGVGPIPSLGSPAVGASGTVFFATCLDELFALDGDSGLVLWIADLGLPDCSVSHHSSPSTSRGGLVVTGSNSQIIYAFDAASGSQLWQYSVFSAIWGSPLIDAAGTVFIVISGGHLLGLEGATGLLRWDFAFASPNPSLVAIPALGRHPVTREPILYIGDGVGGDVVALSAGCNASVGQACICAAGAQPNKTDCSPCPRGEFGSLPGQKPCSPCDVGHFAATEGSISCAECPPGSFSEAPGAAACVLCQAGTFTNVSGSSNCTACPVDQSSGAGAEACVAVPTAPSPRTTMLVIIGLAGVGAAILGVSIAM